MLKSYKNDDLGKHEQLISDIALLLATDVFTYKRYVSSILKMDAESKTTKARIKYIALINQYKVKQEFRRLQKRRT